MTEPMRCGDYGGETQEGNPCRRRVAEAGLCGQHSGEWTGDHYPPAVFIKALKNTGGVLKNVAEVIGCARSTVYEAAKRHPEVEAVLQEEREKLKDLAEERLIEQIQQGNMTAIIWYMKTQMKDRGYVEKQEVEHSGEIKGAEVQVYLPSNDRDDLPEAVRERMDTGAGANGGRPG